MFEIAASVSGLLAFAAADDDLAAFEASTGVPEPTGLTVLANADISGLRRRNSAENVASSPARLRRDSA